MNGIIVVNPYGFPGSSVKQAERLKEEFDKMGVSAFIVDNAFTHFLIEGDKLKSSLSGIDFAVFLDKDKYLSQELTKSGVRIFNSHESIRVCDDKGETCLALVNSGVKMPKTLFAPLCYRGEANLTFDYAEEVISKLSLPVIVKESYGSQGFGVHKADNKQELISLMEKFKLKPHIFQEYLGAKPGVDVRVIVIGKKAVCSMERRNERDFRSNIGQGGGGKVIELSEEFKKTAERCAKVLNLDYCGVDLLYGKNGEPYVCEVNSNAFFEGIEKTTGFNVAKLYAEYIINEMK